MEKIDKSELKLILEKMSLRAGELVLRKDLSRYTNGILHPKTVANLESAGLFQVRRVKIGKHVAYCTTGIIAYIISMASYH
mgnify:CR=1 FL=1